MPGSTPAVEPPPFQEAAHCDVCKCGFNAFRRRHHCRCCGRTLCHEHSSDQMALPQYGTYTNVRVCSDCFNNSTGQRKNEAPSIPNLVAATAEDISRLDMGVDIDSKPQTTTVVVPTQSAPECKCGMPLCICTTALPDPVPEVAIMQEKFSYIHLHGHVHVPVFDSAVAGEDGRCPPVRSSPRPIKANNTKRTAESVSNNVASSSSKPSIFFNMGQQAISRVDQDHGKYEVNGDGLREAIKYSDVKAVKRLLDEGVDPNYRDKQGLSLLHLAALFNQTEIAFILMDHGASLESKNAQGETPLDCAPTMLQYKMRQKMGAGP